MFSEGRKVKFFLEVFHLSPFTRNLDTRSFRSRGVLVTSSFNLSLRTQGGGVGVSHTKLSKPQHRSIDVNFAFK